MSPAPGRPWRRAFAWLLFLAPFFFITYGLANWTAAQRVAVPSLAFGWERAIPFWAWTIVPYWSIDALYGLSLFVCTSRRELDTHAKRLLTAQLFAVACFVAVPYRYSFDRPGADGVFGVMFDALLGFDLPYNQIPSLHIALAVILWVLYARKTRGAVHALLTVWFLLIGASVLTTYQHHFIDIPTGFALGWLCVWLWPFRERGIHTPAAAWRTATAPARHRLALLYAGGALVCLVAALGAGGAGAVARLAGAVAGDRRRVLRRAGPGGLPEGRGRAPAAGGAVAAGAIPGRCLAQLALVDPAPPGARSRSPTASGSGACRPYATGTSSVSRASST